MLVFGVLLVVFLTMVAYEFRKTRVERRMRKRIDGVDELVDRECDRLSGVAPHIIRDDAVMRRRLGLVRRP